MVYEDAGDVGQRRLEVWLSDGEDGVEIDLYYEIVCS